MRTDPVTLFLCGDVMLGRGVDQILPYPGDPTLRESHVCDARTYVDLAEAVNGRIPRPVGFSWPWGDALGVLEEVAPDTRVVNLETSVTRSDDFAVGKAVNYRMNPANLPGLLVARPDVCVLANNHVMDFGRRGLEETLDALADAGLRAAGAGREAGEARRPAIVTVEGGGRVLVLSCGTESSGIPPEWAAAPDRGGVDLVSELSESAAAEVAGRVRRVRRPGDVAVVSIHWGSNWGYHVAREQRRFAHRLVDGGVDVVHGHSSHHPRPVEVYRGRLILYGCGDLIDDYEGITGYEEYRDDLRLLYFVSVEPESGRTAGLRMVPMRARRMRLRHASAEDSEWLRAVLDRVGRDLGSRVDLEPDGALALRWTT
ncbi:CapA family protein [Streptosporangium amethystogenes subsp. fukuiense]|uniref:CapA family protein n=1 Tax=Streptosporangium amethystogenes subsp. fukuiense TaxID=698418 RepID=A0ABW2T0L9_9ACTN